ncbi:hypothetical protein D3C76_1863280 [compost metagenome]
MPFETRSLRAQHEYKGTFQNREPADGNLEEPDDVYTAHPRPDLADPVRLYANGWPVARI